MEGGNQAYNIPLALSLRGRLDVGALGRALERIVERHETLRSGFVPREEGAQVVIRPVSAETLLQREDLRRQPDALALRLREEASTAFDLVHGPLIRACLLQLDEDQHVLALTVHHIVADGWSMGVLVRELMALYPALRQGLADPLPALAIQYGDYAAWQRRWLEGERLQRQVAYWRETLADAPTLLMLPCRPAATGPTGLRRRQSGDPPGRAVEYGLAGLGTAPRGDFVYGPDGCLGGAAGAVVRPGASGYRQPRGGSRPC